MGLCLQGIYLCLQKIYLCLLAIYPYLPKDTAGWLVAKGRLGMRETGGYQVDGVVLGEPGGLHQHRPQAGAGEAGQLQRTLAG